MEKKDPMDEELVAATPTQRNWRGILISLVVIGLVSSLIVTCVILLTPPDLGPRIRGHLVTLEDLVKSTYDVQHDNAEWINEDEIVFRDDDGGVSVFNVGSGAARVLVSNLTLRQKKTERFLVSPDMNFVLLIGRQRKLTEYTGEAQCWLWDVNAGHATTLKPEPWSADRSHPPLQHVTWVARPGGGARGNSALLMVHAGNIFYKEWALSTDSYPVTSDGVPGLVHHGVPDLLYAEHILRSDHAVWPSPRGTLLLYFTVNSTGVAELQYTEYGTGADPSYPRIRSVRYPRAGATNPTLTVTIANVTEPDKMSYHTVLPPSSLTGRELYAAGVRWLDDSQVSVTWYNRRQNSSYVTVCSTPSWRCQTVYQSLTDHGWVEIADGPVFSEDKRGAVLLDRVPDGEDGIFTQIIMVDIASRSVTQMTQQRADVVQILSWTNGYIYYLSGVVDGPGQRHLHRVSDHSSPLSRTTECLTCPPAPSPAPTDSATAAAEPAAAACLQYEALMRRGGGSGGGGGNGSGVRYALRCVGPAVPRLTLPTMNVTLRNGTVLAAAAANLSLPAVQLVSVPLSAGRAALVRLLVPPQYRHGDATSFPLLLWLPAADAVADHRWRVDWPAYLAAQQGFAVAVVQLPAQPPPPEEGALPGAEAAVGAEQVTALRRVTAHLAKTLSFVSPGRVLAAGRGYGGYLALSLLASGDPSPLRCAVALAPITNWGIYVSAASERRLGRPDDNQRGYSDSELGGGRAGAGAAAALIGRRLLLVHGTADTSVSVQHTLLLARRLERAGAIFRQMLYPDEDHQLSGVHEHLYRTLDQYFHECFLPENVRELVGDAI